MSNSTLESYIKAINKIDDYFEYQCQSQKDQQRVHKILKELTEDLVKVPPEPPTTEWVKRC